MSSEFQALVLAAGAGASVLLIVLALARTALAQDILIQSRLAAIHSDTATSLAPPQALTALGRPRPYLLNVLDRVVRPVLGTGPKRQLDRAGVHLTVGDFLAIRIAFVVGSAGVGVLLGQSSVVPLSAGASVLAGAAAGLLAPVVYLRIRIARRAKQIESQLVELCEVMSTMLASGFGDMQALATAADQVGRPLADELHRFIAAVRLGSDFDQALRETRERIASVDFEVVATALEVQRRTGGNLAEILRGVGVTIRERQAFQQELTALTSRERFSAIIVAAFPILLVGALTMLLPDVYGRLFIEPTGRVIFAIALGMDLLGYVVARRLAKLEI